MKKIAMLSFLFGILVISVIQVSYADRGSISFKPNVKIFEPTQRAMIAWNGTEEILLLSTDLKASEATEVLEVIPLPSEPTVKKGDVEAFRKAVDLINKKNQLSLHLRFSKYRSEGMESQGAVPAGEVTFHEKIGAHDISIAHVLSSPGFIDWVEKYLKSQGVENPIIPGPLKDVVQEYISEGFVWFVFDVVSLEEELKTNEAIQYRFKTDTLFYPLKITRTEEGSTSIELLVLTQKLLGNFSGIPAEDVSLRHRPVTIYPTEIKALNEDMAELLSSYEDMKLRIWRISGKLSEFKKDLIAK